MWTPSSDDDRLAGGEGPDGGHDYRQDPRSGNSEAVRLPKEAAFGEGVGLVVVRSGDVVTLYPAATFIPEMIAPLDALPRPTSFEERDEEELPERAGL